MGAEPSVSGTALEITGRKEPRRAMLSVVDVPSHSPHAYPADLAAAALEAIRTGDAAPIESPLLVHGLLTRVLSTVFQASLLQEEGRSVSLRLLLCPPDSLPAEAGPPDGLHALRFIHTRPLEVRELRRLAAAAPFARTLLGACLGSDREPMLWGVVHSGPRWLRIATGARVDSYALPPIIVVTATGPGRIDVRIGDRVLAQLEGGRIGGTTLDVFASRWLPARFAAARAEVLAQHTAERERAGPPWAELDGRLVGGVARHMLRQMIAVIRLSGHGGTPLVVPSVEVPALDAMLRVKYPIADGPPRRRFRAVLLAIANALARSRSGEASGPLGWEDYARSRDAELARLDESVFEPSHMIAGLAAVDGAVVMTSGFEILGFGAEITGRPPEVPCVVIITDDMKGALAKQKPRVAVYVGGMGPRDENFHKEMMVRRGFGDAAQRIQELFLAKRKDEAVAAVPDEFCDEMSLVGPVARIRERYRPWADSGITGLTITTDQPEAMELIAKLANG